MNKYVLFEVLDISKTTNKQRIKQRSSSWFAVLDISKTTNKQRGSMYHLPPPSVLDI